MDTICVAVATRRQPKLAALRDVLNTIGPLLHPRSQFEIVESDCPSGVAHTPLSRAEMMRGAGLRAEALASAEPLRSRCRYFVGMEGGVDVVFVGSERQVFLQNWACVLEAGGRIAFGDSGSILIPDALARKIVDDGVELAAAIDEFAGACGIRDAEGTWGVLTRNVITRQDACRVALINAFAPFFNPAAYGAR